MARVLELLPAAATRLLGSRWSRHPRVGREAGCWRLEFPACYASSNFHQKKHKWVGFFTVNSNQMVQERE